MKRILFVDDEPKILMGLRRSLRTFRDEWEMVFAEGGAAALEQCSTTPFDVVVSDARMPGMEGSVFLRKVMELYPDTARLILSGQCSRTSVLKCVAVAHQFLSKPCEPETLKSAVQGVCKMRDAFSDGAVRQAISRTQWLPSPIRQHRELARAIESSETSIGNISAIIARDIGMTAKVVQLVSSGFFGSPQHVASTAEAVRLLGLETIRALFAPSNELPFCSEERGEEDLQRLTDHSFAVAAVARQIMETLTNDRTLIGDAYLAGVLHEVGTLALTDFGHHVPMVGGCPRERDSATSLSQNAGWGNSGTMHSWSAQAVEAGPDPGGYLVALWGLPDTIVQAITYHRAPKICPEQAFGPLTAVHVANAILEQASDSADESSGRLAMDFLERTGFASRLTCWREICEACRTEGVLQ
jgi:HD-like signal output (HDOD) protein